MLGLRGAGRVVQPLDVVHVLDVCADEGARCLHVVRVEVPLRRDRFELLVQSVLRLLLDEPGHGLQLACLDRLVRGGDGRLNLADAMAGKNAALRPDQGLVKVALAVNAYGSHFDHPGFKPIPGVH